MTIRRLLSAVGIGGGFIGEAMDLRLLYNGATAAVNDYKIGWAETTDGGATWTRSGSNPVLVDGTAGTWDQTYIKDPWLLWDGSQYVCYYAGWNGTKFQIGRATSANGTSWTKYGSNPVVPDGAGGDPDDAGAEFPVVVYDPLLSPAWKMWYMGYPTGATPGSPAGISVCFADSSDGLSWTKRGRVINVGTAGDLDDSGCMTSGVHRDGSTWYVYYAGYRTATNFMKSMYATCTDPADAGTYTKGGVLSGFDGTITAGGKTWRSNLVRQMLPGRGGYRAFVGLWNPSSGSEEAMAQTRASSPTSITLPTSLIFAVPGSGWDANSAENPSVIVAP